MSLVLDPDTRLKFLTPQEAAVGPKSGFCLVLRDKWWITCPERGLAFYKTARDKGLGSPQYHANRQIAEKLMNDLWPGRGFQVTFVPVAFVPVNLRDYY